MPNIKYTSGTCNIGETEVAHRRRIAITGLILCLVAGSIIELTDGSLLWRLAIFPLVVIAFTGFLQARQRFCLAYGLRGFSSITGRKQFVPVTREADLHRDRKASLRLVVQIALWSCVTTLLYYFLPQILSALR
jgi:hypothetical protein